MNASAGSGVLYAIVFLDLLGFGLIIPQLGVYARLFHADGVQMGLLLASFSTMQFVFAPLLGRLSDRHGRRPVLLISLGASVAGYLVFAAARSLPLLFVSRLIHGLGGANIGTAQAFLSDVTPPERRAKAMGMIGAAFGLGFVLGPALGGLLGPLGTRLWGPYGGNLAIGGMAAALSLVTFLLAALRLPESLSPERRGQAARSLGLFDTQAARHAWGHPALSRLMLVFLVATAGFAVLHAVAAFFVMDLLRLDVTTETARVQAYTGVYYTWVGALAIVVQGLAIGPLTRRCGEVRLLVGGLALMTLGLALMPLSGGMIALLAAATPLGVGNSLIAATLPALITFHSPAAQRGEMLGLSQSLGSLGRIIGPLIGGSLYDLGHHVPFLVGATLCGLACLVAAALPRGRAEYLSAEDAP